jgi:K+-transporting ATPase KdpF subunit
VQRGARMTLELVGGLIALIVAVYLLYTLLRAERF